MCSFIDLFKYPEWIDYKDRDNGILKQKKCIFTVPQIYYNINSNKSDYEGEVLNHSLKVMECSRHERYYEDFIGLFLDSHYEVEKLGIARYCKGNTVIFSLGDCFEFVFSLLSNSVIPSQKNKPWYKDYSNYFFNINNIEQRVKLEDLVDINPLLTWKLFSILTKNRKEFTLNLIKEVHNLMNNIIDYVGYCIRFNVDNILNLDNSDGVTIRSKNLDSLIFTMDDESYKNLPEEIILRYKVGDKETGSETIYLNINIEKYKQMEYFNILLSGGKNEI